MGTHAHTTSGVDFVVLATAPGELIEAHAAAVTGPGGDGAPTWAALAGRSPSVRYPVEVLAALIVRHAVLATDGEVTTERLLTSPP